MRLGIAVVLITFAQGCTQTHFKFPPGKTMADFEQAQRECSSMPLIPCMQRRGYRVVSEEEAERINQVAAQGLDVAGFNMTSGDIFLGKSVSTPGSRNASIEVETLGSNTKCSGYAELVKTTAQGKGSMGKLDLICKDGRTVTGTFVYETSLSGWGIGADSHGHEYRFKFVLLSLNPEKLRKDFQKMIKDPQKSLNSTTL
tara:strand:+ start:1988 stop:2587 length:600 start_codon:yes stop_codon:yes gene_type:complete